eukprot:Tamp_34458.p1 GENE.Tamp_34458~~Tamp_34458.p1  ORF type:complete len:190 (-),score=55.38 Tamp_34458:32-574(-)
MDPDDLGSDEEEEILQEFMMAHSEQVGKKKWRCELCEKEFSTVNIMRVHFEKAHKKEAMTWFQEGGAMGGEAQAMEEMMEAMMMMGGMMSAFEMDMGGGGPGGGPGKITAQGFKPAKGGKTSAHARRKGKGPVKIGGTATAPKKSPASGGAGGAGGGGQAGAAASRARVVMLSDSDSDSD